jgi:thiamine-triphosphatase
MIEVEKKFRLTKEQRESIIKDAKFISERTFTDVYYDTPDYKLTTKDIWLRQRDGKFEIKISLKPDHRGRLADQYEEIEDENIIREKIGLEKDGSLCDALSDNGYNQFLVCTTTRCKYSKPPFTIDMDLVTYKDDDFTYTLAEIECMVSNQSDVPEAIQNIQSFAQSHGCELELIRGKGVEYLFRKKPEHYQALVKAGVISDRN